MMAEMIATYNGPQPAAAAKHNLNEVSPITAQENPGA